MQHYTASDGKVYVNARGGQHFQAVKNVSSPGSGVLQILTDSEGNVHPMAIFEGEQLHFQYWRDTMPKNWRLRPWSGMPGKSYGALIQLTPTEAQRLRETLTGMKDEQGPEGRDIRGRFRAGDRWDRQSPVAPFGHIKSIRNNPNYPYFDCSSGWCQMPIGDSGQNLAALTGVHTTSVGYGLVQSLQRSNNERVFGVVVYGSDPQFGQGR
jgi:hypothetical protein